MLMPCELGVKIVLPVIRGAVASELNNQHGLKQTQIANLLGVTQAAVSNYLRKNRGTAFNLSEDKQLQNIVEAIAVLITKKGSKQATRLKICIFCKTIRKKGLLCETHKRLDPNATKDCELCMDLIC